MIEPATDEQIAEWKTYEEVQVEGSKVMALIARIEAEVELAFMRGEQALKYCNANVRLKQSLAKLEAQLEEQRQRTLDVEAELEREIASRE